MRTPDTAPRLLHTLYLGRGATADRGPAIAVGQIDEGDNGYAMCGGGRTRARELSSSGWPDTLLHLGSRTQAFAPEARDESTGYVFGREVSQKQVLDARDASRLGANDRLTVPPSGLPAGFREVARAHVGPNQRFGEVVTLVSESGSSVRLGAYDRDETADLLTRFWDRSVADQRCDDSKFARMSRDFGRTHVLVEGYAPRRVVRDVIAKLRPVNPEAFAEFRSGTSRQSAAALLQDCDPSLADSAVLDGSHGGLRWALAFPVRPGIAAAYCSTYVVNGRTTSGGMSFGPPSPTPPQIAGPGSYGIEIHGGVTSLGGPDGDVRIVAGSVPLGTKRVVITRGTETAVEAVVRDAPANPTRRYFAGPPPEPPADQPFTPYTIVAYDATGREIGRFVST